MTTGHGYIAEAIERAFLVPVLHALQLPDATVRRLRTATTAEGQTHRCRSRLHLWPIVTSPRVRFCSYLTRCHITKAYILVVFHFTFPVLNWNGSFSALADSPGRDWRYGDGLVPEEVCVAVIVPWRPPLLSPVNVSGQKNPAETGWHFTGARRTAPPNTS